MLKTAIYEDNSGLRAALAALVGGTPGFELVGSFGVCTAAVEQCRLLLPDVVLMDIDMPKMDGIEGARRLKAALPEIEIVMLTVFDDDDRVFQAIQAGASGYLLKETPPARILAALQEVREGGAPMTPSVARKALGFLTKSGQKSPDLALLSARETEVLNLLAGGKSYKMAASDLSISTDTVRSHVRKIYDKLHVHSLPEAVSKVFLKG